jgi:hypothetical protein
MDALSGQYGGSYSGYYGGPIQSYTRPITVEKRMQLTEMYSNTTQGKAVVDQFGRLLGYEKEGTNVERRAQERLLAQLMGATAAQLTGAGKTAGGNTITTFLTPEQMEQLNRYRQQFGFGGTGEAGAAMASGLGAPGVPSVAGMADVASPGIPRSLSPKMLLGIAAGVLVLAFLARR